MTKQIAFVFDGTKYITLIGAGNFMTAKKISPESNVGYFDVCSSAGSAVLFNREFGMYPTDVPVLTKMSVCKQDEKGSFIVHGSFMDGDEVRDVSVSHDKIVFHKSRKEREAEAEEIRREHEARAQAQAQEQEQEQTPTPSLADFNEESIMKMDLEPELDAVPEPPISDSVPVVENEEKLTETEKPKVGMSIGRTRRKKRGISFGPVKVQPIVEAPIVHGENVLADFPGSKPKEKPVEEKHEAKASVSLGEGATFPMKLTEEDVEIVHEDPLRKMATGVSAMEALTGQSDMEFVASNNTINTLVADKLDKLNAVPLSMLQMTAAFVPHRSGINFDELESDGIDYVRAHKWEEEGDWFCCDILDSATRVFYNTKENTTFEFKSSECSAMYEKRRILSEETV